MAPGEPDESGNGLLQRRLMQELQDVILRNLDATQLALCCGVSRNMRAIATGFDLWTSLFKRRWGAPYLSLIEETASEHPEEEDRRAAFGGGVRGAYAVEHQDQTLTVDGGDAGRNLGDGFNSYGTIGGAIEADIVARAQPEGAHRGIQRIVIFPGSYSEHLQVERVVGLIGGGKEPTEVVIQGDREAQNGTLTPLKWKVPTMGREGVEA
jgi:hypothetical protein